MRSGHALKMCIRARARSPMPLLVVSKQNLYIYRPVNPLKDHTHGTARPCPAFTLLS
jgi:hypothetical protein